MHATAHPLRQCPPTTQIKPSPLLLSSNRLMLPAGLGRNVSRALLASHQFGKQMNVSSQQCGAAHRDNPRTAATTRAISRLFVRSLGDITRFRLNRAKQELRPQKNYPVDRGKSHSRQSSNVRKSVFNKIGDGWRNRKKGQQININKSTAYSNGVRLRFTHFGAKTVDSGLSNSVSGRVCVIDSLA